ncbi:hypothetical protein Tsubulata_016883 [Turnera subulata]|uniref:Bifunctional inhibitor/plant lipid transfer protein/seed storage helical domain-containing protein n=1 Tax=Turnera subulata TaxID=218843 RepID=A0A9Q0F1H8_9ROSI|nr:hypothetical protein Tsubulata_016883 [Turnera subulata]
MMKSFIFWFMLVSLLTIGHSTHHVIKKTPALPSLVTPSQLSNCSKIIYDMVGCISFLTTKTPAPSKSCCSGYERIIGVSPKCLCAALDASAKMHLPVNLTRAVALPSLCGIPEPDIECDGASNPSPPSSPEIPPPPPRVSSPPPKVLSPPPPKDSSQSPNCSKIIYDMVGCISFLTTKTPAPSKSCCSGYERIISVSPICLCAALDASAKMHLLVNLTRAAALPSMCGIADPNVKCNNDIPPQPAPPKTSSPPPPVLSSPPPKASSPPPPKNSSQPNCSKIIYSMVGCISFLTTKTSMPSKACCSGYKSIISVSPVCLCAALDASVSMHLPVNLTRAAALPSVCGIADPNIQCNNDTPSPPPQHAPPKASSPPPPTIFSPPPKASSPPPPKNSSQPPNCSKIIYNMVGCISFLTTKAPTPSKSCCSGYESIINVSPVCLCAALDASVSMHLPVNLTRAAALPSMCGIAEPDIQCGGVSSPSPPGSPETPPQLPPPKASSPPPTVSPPPPPTASSPPPDCSKIIYDMVDCVSFLTSGSTTTEPGKSCCSGYESIIGVSPVCLCAAFEASANMHISVNLTRAVALPSLCGIDDPKVNCNNAPGPPSSSPETPTPPAPKASAPSPPTDGSESPPTPTDPSEQPSAPAQAPSEGGAGSISVSLLGSISLLFVASFSNILM